VDPEKGEETHGNEEMVDHDRRILDEGKDIHGLLMVKARAIGSRETHDCARNNNPLTGTIDETQVQDPSVILFPRREKHGWTGDKDGE
jgi:hypothetical protein